MKMLKKARFERNVFFSELKRGEIMRDVDGKFTSRNVEGFCAYVGK
jgi:hypothetical protein